MRRAAIALAVALAVAAAAPRARACASCGCGDPTLTATGVERPYRNRVRLALEERYGELAQGAGLAQQRVQFLRQSLALTWSPHKRVTLAAMMPWVTSWIEPAANPRFVANGLGDLETAVRAVAYQERSFAPHHVLWAQAGLKLPTGYRAYDSAGFPIPDDDQPGSGSWDPFTGVTYAWFSGELLSFYASVTGRLTTRGWHGYRRGSTVAGSAALQFQPRAWGGLQLGSEWVWQAADSFGTGADVPDTGGTVGYLMLAGLVNPWRDLLIRFVADAPLVTVMRGTQTVGPQLALQLAYDFN